MPGRTELVVLTGTHTAGVERVIARLRAHRPGAAVLHHDLRDVAAGVVRRRLRHGATDERTVVELAHGCVSCTLREDVLPQLRMLGRRSDVDLVVLHLDAALAPEQTCWAILHVVTAGALVTDVVDLRGVVAVIDAATWLGDATGSDDVADRPALPCLPGDERTMAQLAVEQAEFADLLVVDPGGAQEWELLRTDAVLARLAPSPVRLSPAELDGQVLLGELPYGARRGRPDRVHAPLLRGEPPLHTEADVTLTLFTARRPFHPDRLHTAMDTLLDGVVRARGRIWLATRPDAVIWLESAGGGLQIGHSGEWLAADPAAWDHADPERRAAAALRWHPRFGDRVQELTILSHDADPADIRAALRAALLDDTELAAGEAAWARYPDPFGWWHTDPCGELTPEPAHPHHDHEEH